MEMFDFIIANNFFYLPKNIEDKLDPHKKADSPIGKEAA